MTDTTSAVTAGVQAYADAEAGLRAAHDALLKLPATYRSVFAANPAPVEPSAATSYQAPAYNGGGSYGYLESEQNCATAVVFAGKIAALLNDLLWQHTIDTSRAKSLGIDLPMPAGAHPDGGGR